jgi:ATP-dependent DNA helicase RecG
LIPESQEEAENSRLAAMTETNDGFVLAEKDLDLRGPGDFLGSRQSGFVELKLASLTDVRLIEKARRFAMAVFEADSELASPENASLLQAVERFWSDGKGDIS